MATTIINPASNNDSSNNNMISLFVGVIIVIVLVALFWVYGVPLLRGLNGSKGIQINLPVPSTINVNVQQTK